MSGWILLLTLVSPAAPPGEPSAADTAFFEQKIRPLLADRCLSCHSHQSKKHKGGLFLDSRAALLQGGDSGPAAVPGQPDASLVVRAVRRSADAPAMPPAGPLPAGETTLLEEWVRRGVPHPGAATPASPPVLDLDAGRAFWSFQPLKSSPLPPVRAAAWPRNRLDVFLLAAQEQAGLAPAPEADRHTLVRRLFFDLAGLPPTPEQVDAFVNDPAPDAYERLVERLLASPHYGERWGRFWLDLARYADIREDWAEGQAQPWTYRDWVVRAFNEDMPYDGFVRRQLAADVLSPDPADRAALGFLALSPTYWKELKLDPAVIKGIVAEELEEKVAAVTATFLGLTVACARCHDHKYDPVTMHDYYALAGVLSNARPVDCELLPAPEAARNRQTRALLLSLDEQLAALKKQTPPPPDLARQSDRLQAQAAVARRANPLLDRPLAPGVDDAALDVLPDGTSRTRLVYRPGEVRDLALQFRGNPNTPGPVVPRRFLAVLSAGTPRPLARGSGRADLADALVSDAAPLAARVLVNRVWRHHFGKGLVETPSDFGRQGDRPTHPELLDDLAARFVTSGWSVKGLHREIVLSAAYRQVSIADARTRALDPDNRLLARTSRRRLEVEAWRDSMLTVSGTLSPALGGPPRDLADPAHRRRTLYGTVKRRELNDLLRLHDFPDPTAHSAARMPTTTPLQQLFTLNSPFLRQQADALARRLRTDAAASRDARVGRAYALLFGRPPTAAEVSLAAGFLSPETDELWAEYAQALLASNEFLFVD